MKRQKDILDLLFETAEWCLRSPHDTVVRHRHSFLTGRPYTETDGECFRCNGTGRVRGQTCRKCDGTGRFHKKTWHDNW